MLKRIALLPSIVLFLQACAGVPNVAEPPKITIQHVQLQDISLTEGTALVTLNVLNPNSFPLPLQGIEYGLTLNGRQVARGEREQGIMLRAQEQAPVTLPIKLDFVELVRLAPEVVRSRGVNYDLSGAVRLPLIKVPFRRQGGVGIRP